jgi:hypothetical protein
MEEKYKAFLAYDWQNSAEWQLYYSNLFPTPPGNKIIIFKKKFYNLKVDPDFDRNYSPPDQTSETRSSSTGSTGYSGPGGPSPVSYYPKPERGTLWDKITASLEALLWGTFIFSVFSQTHTHKLACGSLIFRVYRRIGRPRWNTQYAYDLFLDEHFQLFLYAALLFMDNFTTFVFMPVIITGFLNFGEYLKNYFVIGFISNIGSYIYSKRVEIAATRANIMVATAFILIPTSIYGINSFVLTIFYWQYLRLVYILNTDLKGAFSNLGYYIDKFKAFRYTPSILSWVINKIQEFFAYMVRTEAKPGEMAGGSNCTIF